MTPSDVPSVLVLGKDERVRPILDALRARGMRAWADEAPSAIADDVSFEWADAIVLVHEAAVVDEATIGLLAGREQPTILLSSAPLDTAARSSIFGRGIDAVESWPAPADVIAARAASLLHYMPPTESARREAESKPRRRPEAS